MLPAHNDTQETPGINREHAYLRYIAFSLLLGLAVLFGFIKLSDDDVFWQLATGR